MPPEPVILGFSIHTGWAIRVAVAGSPSSFEVLDRARVELLPPDLQRFVYHAAAEMDLADAARLVARVKEGARLAAKAAIVGVEWKTAAVAFFEKRPAAEKPLAEILASHSAIHTAEGILYRNAVRQAAEDCGLPAIPVQDKDCAELKSRIAAMKKTLGPPWALDHQLATLAALLAR